MKMKLLLICQMVVLAMLVSCNNNGDVSIAVKDEDDYYRFRAQFDDNLSADVSRFLNDQLSTVRIDPEKDSKIITVLPDQTRITVESSPGEVMIYLDKDENSRDAYHRIKNLCEGVKDVILKHNRNNTRLENSRSN
ncbi:hypothetical protein J2Y45_003583 [Dyadobacter sp. BE34]|uniref:Lipoprotein n=1 Tax=Dyadobacter fermentans TaxID=94254 RepID=A0ABU1QZ01_9BACT|nr:MULTISPECIES: hypothetical protein [Dyadobacter]MDR6806391.1 hypothetical protein [Dyadobacter fermentans]MDR7044132.1 hypothetical protein [Dyadobacter sp. BE242]MDR7198443.1 hypothetical protein [Dyadobacter sp. BE34]MDR7216405.1 hypothetical protein [Dyadobacter sp. BE31]MDR7264068.1 hypothetical protein [Dyadobacter sp. BE32]